MNEVEFVLGRLCPIVGLVGLILNSLVAIVFSTSTFGEQVLYSYLKYEAVLICLDLLITIFKPLYYCSTCAASRQLLAQIYQVYFNIYGASVLEMCALMCRNFSALICLVLIWSDRHQASRTRFTQIVLDKKATNKIVLVVIVASSCALYSYHLFEYRIVPKIGWSNETYYDIGNTQFGDSVAKARLEIAATILRDCVNLLILVVLNCLIIYRLRVSLHRKKKIIKIGIKEAMTRSIGDESGSAAAVVAVQQPSSGKVNALRNIKRKENLQTVMMILTCLNYLLGRLPLLYLFVKRNLFTDSSNFGIYAILIAYISYTLNFLFYYVSNFRFRGSINSYLKNIFSFIR